MTAEVAGADLGARSSMVGAYDLFSSKPDWLDSPQSGCETTLGLFDSESVIEGGRNVTENSSAPQ